MDRHAVERMLNAGKKDAPSRETTITDTTAEFEEYTAEPRVDAQGNPIPKPKGLRAAGYQWPPPGPEPPLTKENLAKGLGRADNKPAPPKPSPTPGPAPSSAPGPHTASPSQPRGASPAPSQQPPRPTAPVKVDDDGLSEVYVRPGLDQNPRTGKGIRTPPPEPKKADEILSGWKQPEASVVTPKRFQVFPARTPTPDSAEAELHASVDVGAAPDAVMSKSIANGPRVEVVDDDPLHGLPGLTRAPPPGAPVIPESVPEDAPVLGVDLPHAALAKSHAPQMEAPSPPMPAPATEPARQTHASEAAPVPTASTPHVSEAPAVPSGEPVRIALVQSDFNQALTDAMVERAAEEGQRLGSPAVGHVHVPGVFDTPLAVQSLLERSDVDGVVVIGCVIQGETGHDEVITYATAKSLQELSLRFRKPVALAITGPRMTETQAWARIDSGAFAMASAVAQHRLLQTV